MPAHAGYEIHAERLHAGPIVDRDPGDEHDPTHTIRVDERRIRANAGPALTELARAHAAELERAMLHGGSRGR